MEIKIRELNVGDIFCVARMLGKITKGARAQLVMALKTKKVDPTEFGVIIVQSVLIEVEEDLKAWLADLIGKEKGEFERMPAVALLDIIEKLAGQEGSRDFFTRASQLATKLTSSEVATRLAKKG